MMGWTPVLTKYNNLDRNSQIQVVDKVWNNQREDGKMSSRN